MQYESIAHFSALSDAADQPPIPRLPTLGWATFRGPRDSPLPSVLDAPSVTFTTSGRAAIALALRALRITAGDRVLVPTYHCPTMIAPIVAAGAVPVFFPIDATGAPQLDGLGEQELCGARAIIAAHYFGLPQPFARLRAFCDLHGIALIEDCAHALFGRSDGRPVGQWGDFAIASLTKFLPVMDGGCLVGASDEARMRKSSALPIKQQFKSFVNALEIGARYERLPGMNTLLLGAFGGMTRLRAPKNEAQQPRDATSTVASKWLADFDLPSIVDREASWWTRWTVRHAHRGRIVELRRRNYRALTKLVSAIEGMHALMPLLPDDAAPYVFPLYVERPQAIYRATRACGIPVFRWDELWPTCPAIPKDEGLRWASHVFQIGCHQDLRREEIQRMGKMLRVLASAEEPRPATKLATRRYADGTD